MKPGPKGPRPALLTDIERMRPLVGTMTDRAIAAQLGLSMARVWYVRDRMGAVPVSRKRALDLSVPMNVSSGSARTR